MWTGHHLPRWRRGIDRGRSPHRCRGHGIPRWPLSRRRRRALEDVGLVDEVDLVVAGGIRNGEMWPRLRAGGQRGSDWAFIADGSQLQQGDPRGHRLPGNGGSPGRPVLSLPHRSMPGGGDHPDPELRARLDVDEAADRVYNFLTAMTMELQMLARACGKTDVHSLEPEDLCALTLEAAAMAKVPLAGTSYIPGLTEQDTLIEIKTMLAKYLANQGFRAMSIPMRVIVKDTQRFAGTKSVTPKCWPGPGGPINEPEDSGGHRPDGSYPWSGPQLVGRHSPSRRGWHAGGLRPLLELLPEDLLPDPGAGKTNSPGRC